MQYTVGTQYTVGLGAKNVNSHSGLSKYEWWGPLPLVQKGQTHAVGYAVGTQYAVGAKKVNPTCTAHLLHTPLCGFDVFALKVTFPTTYIC